MRNRMMALWSTAFLGSTFIGGPLLGLLAQSAGPRWALGVGAIGGIVAAGVGWLAVRRAPAAQTHDMIVAERAEESAA
jgi:MFS family permease